MTNAFQKKKSSALDAEPIGLQSQPVEADLNSLQLECQLPYFVLVAPLLGFLEFSLDGRQIPAYLFGPTRKLSWNPSREPVRVNTRVRFEVVTGYVYHLAPLFLITPLSVLLKPPPCANRNETGCLLFETHCRSSFTQT